MKYQLPPQRLQRKYDLQTLISPSIKAGTISFQFSRSDQAFLYSRKDVLVLESKGNKEQEEIAASLGRVTKNGKEKIRTNLS